MNIWEWAGVSLAVLVVLAGWYLVLWAVRTIAIRLYGRRAARTIGRVSRRIGGRR